MRQGIILKFICLAFLLCTLGCAHIHPEAPAAAPKQPGPYLNMMLARDAENRGEWQEALKLYSTIDDPFAWLAQARIYFILNQTDTALGFVDRLIESNTYTDEALELRTKLYARKGDWKQAIADTQTLVRKYPDNRQLKLFLANLKIVVSDFAGARNILENLMGSPDDSMVLYTLSKACFGAKDLECAKESLQRVIETSPNFHPAYLDLGKVLELMGQPRQAEDTYLQLLKLDPSSGDGLVALSELYISNKRYTEAIPLVEKLTELHPDVQILRKLILLKLQVGLFNEALKDFDKIEDKTSEDQYYLAITYARLEKFESSLKALDAIPPDSSLGCDAAVLKSSILKDMNRPDESLQVLSSAWEVSSDKEGCSELGFQLATELDSAGRRQEGLEVALKLLDKNPHDPVALNFVGYVWADMGINLDRAYDLIREALEIRPEDPFILDSMSWVLFKKNRGKEALHYMKKALSRMGSDPTINEHMGDILKSLGKKDKALDYYIKSSVLGNNGDAIQNKIDELLE